MAFNREIEKKRIKRIEKTIVSNPKIMEAIRKGGKIEINIKDEGVEFWRKEKGEGKKLVSKLDKISGKKCLCGYFNIVSDLMRDYNNTYPDYKASLNITTRYNN
jgi:hypothetical protein